MKKFLLCTAMIGFMACSGPQSDQGFTIDITVDGNPAELPSDTLLFKAADAQAMVIPPVILVNGKARVSGVLTTPENYDVFFPGKKSFTSIFLENAAFVMDIKTDDLEASFVDGGTVQHFFVEKDNYQNRLAEELRLDSLSQVYEHSNPDKKAEIDLVFKNFFKSVKDYDRNYRDTHPYSPYTLLMLAGNLEQISLDSAARRLAEFKAMPEYEGNYKLEKAQVSLENLISIQLGKQVPDFTQNDMDGNPVSLSDVYRKNEVTMVDFWASWCRPCRAFNPQLLEIYEQFHSKGFGILGVSLDSRKERWEQAVKADNLPWMQVSDLKGWDNAFAGRFYVRSVPQNILVDRDGIILARNASREKILEILQERL